MSQQEIQRYLNEENMFYRSTEEIYRELDEADAQWLRNFLNYRYTISDEELYKQTSRKLGHTSTYDYLKSRVRPSIEDTLEKILELRGVDCERIIDIGCGTGLESVFLAEITKNGYVIGVDTSREMLEIAKERAEKRKLSNIEFILADRDNLPFKDSDFDMALCLQALTENYKDYYDLDKWLLDKFSEFKRILRENGCLIISTDVRRKDEIDTGKGKLIYLLASVGFEELKTSDFSFTNKDTFESNSILAYGKIL